MYKKRTDFKVDRIMWLGLKASKVQKYLNKMSRKGWGLEFIYNGYIIWKKDIWKNKLLNNKIASSVASHKRNGLLKRSVKVKARASGASK